MSEQPASSEASSWSDSRAASRRFYAVARQNPLLRLFALGAVCIVSVSLWRALTLDLELPQRLVLLLLFVALGLWITEAVPPFAVGLFGFNG